MKCMSCEADIPPAWVNAIQKNECPGCGGAIMDDSSKELLNELRDAMVKMPNDAEGLAGWLLSNYDLFKKGEGAAEPTNFHRKRVGGGEYQGQLKIADPAAQRFMRLAGADKVVQNPKAAAIVAAINKAHSSEQQYDQNEEEDIADPTPEEEMEAAEANAAAILAQRKGKRITAKELLTNNVAFNIGADRGLSEDETEVVQNMWGGPDAPTALDPPNIQADRMRRLMAQRELSAGGTIGKITRR